MNKLPHITINTERLLLRPLTDLDKNGFAQLLMNKEIAKTFMIPSFARKEDYLELAAKIIANGINQSHLAYGIYLGDILIGFMNDCGFDDEEMEIGYALDPDYWNKGYMSEALKAMIAELFAFGFKRIVAGYFEDNPASGKVMEKCLMKRTEHKETIEYQGKMHKCLYMEIGRKD